MAIDKDFYNKSSSDSLGWKPDWFGAEFFDEDLIKKVKKFQKSHSLVADGLVGPTTYRRIFTERESAKAAIASGSKITDDSKKYIVHNGAKIPIKWDKVVLWEDANGLKTKPGTYYDYSGKADRKPTFFVNHWDVCLSSRSCADVLAQRGISVHFSIDNDGTIYQLLDTQHAAWHAGNSAANRKSIGVEISNAYYPKYQDWYVKNGFGKRPLMTKAVVHNWKVPEFMWFYDAQLEALIHLWEAVSRGTGIPLTYPKDSAEKLSTTVHNECAKATFKGFCSHYNISKKKIDCAGLEIDKLLKKL